ncbi:MAG: signal peptidase I [Eubacterium sp.]|nr:signal peptidase I [Eubacterium sp.]
MKKALKIILDVLAWILLIIALLITILVFASARNDGIPNIFGIMPMSVKSDSMSPTFKKGDMIIVKEIDDLYSLQKDDVITFYTIVDGSRIINTHRIVDIKEEGGSRSYITRGDNNSVDDNLPVGASDIIGRWTGTKLGGIGGFFDYLQTKTGFFVCVIIPIALFFIFELYKFIMTLLEAKKEAAGEEQLDEEEIKRRAVEEYLAKQAAEKEAAEGAAEAAESAAETAGDAAESVADVAGDTAEAAGDAAEAAGDAAEAAAETAEAAEDSTAE